MAEMLARCGIGKLILYDYDRVELANMNRMFYTPAQCGLAKTEAACRSLASINPDVALEAHDEDVTKQASFEGLVRAISTGGVGGGPVQLVLSAVDNYAARSAINQVDGLCLPLPAPPEISMNLPVTQRMGHLTRLAGVQRPGPGLDGVRRVGERRVGPHSIYASGPNRVLRVLAALGHRVRCR